jgi:hypothetical protein
MSEKRKLRLRADYVDYVKASCEPLRIKALQQIIEIIDKEARPAERRDAHVHFEPPEPPAPKRRQSRRRQEKRSRSHGKET